MRRLTFLFLLPFLLVPSLAGAAPAAPAVPEGRVLCGFDSQEDLKKWEIEDPYHPVEFTLTTEAKEVKEGEGAARIRLSRDPDYTTGALVFDVGKIDAARFRGLSAWIYVDKPQPGRLEFAFIKAKTGRLPWIDGPFGGSELGTCIYFATPLSWQGWNLVKMPAAAFQQRSGKGGGSKPTLPEVRSLVIYDATRKGLEFTIDSLRVIEAPEKK